MQGAQVTRSSASSQHSRSSASSFDALLDEIGATLSASGAASSISRTTALPAALQLQQVLHQASKQHQMLMDSLDYGERSPGSWLYRQQEVQPLATVAAEADSDALSVLRPSLKQQPRLTAIAEESSSYAFSPTASSAQHTLHSEPVLGLSTPASAAQSGIATRFSSTQWMSGKAAATAAITFSNADTEPASAVRLAPGSRGIRLVEYGSGAWNASGATSSPSTPAATAVTDSPHNRSISHTPAISGSSAKQLIQSGPASPSTHGISAFLRAVNPVDSWVATHSLDAPPPQGSCWSNRPQSITNTGSDIQPTSKYTCSYTGATSAAATTPEDANLLAEAAAQRHSVPQQVHEQHQQRQQWLDAAGQQWDASNNAAPGVLSLPAGGISQLDCWDSPTTISAAVASPRAVSSRVTPAAGCPEESACGEFTASCMQHSSQRSAGCGTRGDSGLNHELSVGWHGCRRSSSVSNQQSDSLQQERTSSNFHLLQQGSSEVWAGGQVPETPAAFSGHYRQQHTAAPWADGRSMKSSVSAIYQCQQQQRGVEEDNNQQQQQQQQALQLDAEQGHHAAHIHKAQNFGQQQAAKQLLDNSSRQQREQQHAQAAVLAINSSTDSSNQALLSVLNPLEFVLWQQRQHQHMLLERALHALTTLQSDVDDLLQAHQIHAVGASGEHPQQQPPGRELALESTAQLPIMGNVQTADGHSAKQHVDRKQHHQQLLQKNELQAAVAVHQASTQLAADGAVDKCTIPAIRGRELQSSMAIEPALQQQQQNSSTTTGDSDTSRGRGMPECREVAYRGAARVDSVQETLTIAGSDAVDLESFEAELLQSEAAAPGRRLSDGTLRHYYTEHVWSDCGRQEREQQQQHAGNSITETSANIGCQLGTAIAHEHSFQEEGVPQVSGAGCSTDWRQQQQQVQGHQEDVFDDFEAHLLAMEAAEPGRRLSKEEEALQEEYRTHAQQAAATTGGSQAADIVAQAASTVEKQMAATAEVSQPRQIAAMLLAKDKAEPNNALVYPAAAAAAATAAAESSTLFSAALPVGTNEGAAVTADASTVAVACTVNQHAVHVTFALPGDSDSTADTSGGSRFSCQSCRPASNGEVGTLSSEQQQCNDSMHGSECRTKQLSAASDMTPRVAHQAGDLTGLTVVVLAQGAGLTDKGHAGSLTGAAESSSMLELHKPESGAAVAGGMVLNCGCSSICNRNAGSDTGATAAAAAVAQPCAAGKNEPESCTSRSTAGCSKIAEHQLLGDSGGQSHSAFKSEDDFEALLRANEQAARQAAGHSTAAATEDRWWEDAPSKASEEQEAAVPQPPQSSLQQQQTGLSNADQASATAEQTQQQPLPQPQEKQPPVEVAVALLLEKQQQQLRQLIKTDEYKVLQIGATVQPSVEVVTSSSSSKRSIKQDADMLLDFGRVGSIGGASGLPLSPRTAAKTGILEFEWIAAQALQPGPTQQQQSSQQQQADNEAAHFTLCVATAAEHQCMEKQQCLQQQQLENKGTDMLPLSRTVSSMDQAELEVAHAQNALQQQQQQQQECIQLQNLQTGALPAHLNGTAVEAISSNAVMAGHTRSGFNDDIAGSSGDSISIALSGAEAGEADGRDSSRYQSPHQTSDMLGATQATGVAGATVDRYSGDLQQLVAPDQTRKQQHLHQEQLEVYLPPVPTVAATTENNSRTTTTSNNTVSNFNTTAVVANVAAMMDINSAANIQFVAAHGSAQAVLQLPAEAVVNTAAACSANAFTALPAEHVYSSNLHQRTAVQAAPTSELQRQQHVHAHGDPANNCQSSSGTKDRRAHESSERQMHCQQPASELACSSDSQKQVGNTGDLAASSTTKTWPHAGGVSSSSSSTCGETSTVGGAELLSYVTANTSKQPAIVVTQPLAERSTTDNAASDDDASMLYALGPALNIPQGGISSSSICNHQQQQHTCRGVVEVQPSLAESSLASSLPGSLSFVNSSFLSLPCEISADAVAAKPCAAAVFETVSLSCTQQHSLYTPGLVSRVDTGNSGQVAAVAGTQQGGNSASSVAAGGVDHGNSVGNNAPAVAKKRQQQPRHHMSQQQLQQQDDRSCNCCRCCDKASSTGVASRQATAAAARDTATQLPADCSMLTHQHLHVCSGQLHRQSSRSSSSSRSSMRSGYSSLEHASSDVFGSAAAEAGHHTHACKYTQHKGVQYSTEMYAQVNRVHGCRLAKKLAGIDTKLQEIQQKVQAHVVEEERIESELRLSQQQLQQQKQQEQHQQWLWEAEAADICFATGTSTICARPYRPGFCIKAFRAGRQQIDVGEYDRSEFEALPAAGAFSSTGDTDINEADSMGQAWCDTVSRQQGWEASYWNAKSAARAMWMPQAAKNILHGTTFEDQLETELGFRHRPWSAAAGTASTCSRLNLIDDCTAAGCLSNSTTHSMNLSLDQGSHLQCSSSSARQREYVLEQQKGQLYGVSVGTWMLPRQCNSYLPVSGYVHDSLQPPQTPDLLESAAAATGSTNARPQQVQVNKFSGAYHRSAKMQGALVGGVTAGDRIHCHACCHAAAYQPHGSVDAPDSALARPVSAPAASAGRHVISAATSSGIAGCGSNSVAAPASGNEGQINGLWSELIRECQTEMIDQVLMLSETAGVCAETRAMIAALRTSWDVLHG